MDIGMPIGGANDAMSYPASLAQTRFWLLDALDPGTPALNVAVRWTLRGPITPERVAAAFHGIVARHEILRTALVSVDGCPVQMVWPALPFHVRHHDLRALPEPERVPEADRLGVEEARTPFSLEAPPLLRAVLITLGPQTARLLVTLHHVICDGWSIGLLANELGIALGNTLADAAILPEPPPLPLQYGDFVRWQQAWLDSAALDRARAFWVAELAALPYVSVPPDHTADQRGGSAIASILLPRSLTDRMAEDARRHGCTLFAVALAGLGQVLQQRSGADDIPIGTQIAGRDEPELEAMIGPFINTLVLRLRLDGDGLNRDTRIARAAATLAAALDHHAMPFELLIRALNPPRTRHRTPLFSVNLIFQRSFVATTDYGVCRLEDMPSHSAGALYDLNFFMVERPDGWRASCEYDVALYDAASVAAMLEEWRAALTGDPPAQAKTPARSLADAALDRLAAIWCETLGIDQVRPEQGFFDLGGHSLLAARMLAHVEAVFGRRIGMAALFDDSTLGGLAAKLRRPEELGMKAQILAEGGNRTPIIALGPATEWRSLSIAIGPAHPFTCLAEPAFLLAEQLHPTGRIAVLGAGRQAAMAFHLAQSLRAAGREVVLVAVDGAAPHQAGPPARMPWRKRPKAAAPSVFDGHALLFLRRSAAADPTEGWAGHLEDFSLARLPDGLWQAQLARCLRTALG